MVVGRTARVLWVGRVTGRSMWGGQRAGVCGAVRWQENVGLSEERSMEVVKEKVYVGGQGTGA